MICPTVSPTFLLMCAESGVTICSYVLICSRHVLNLFNHFYNIATITVISPSGPIPYPNTYAPASSFSETAPRQCHTQKTQVPQAALHPKLWASHRILNQTEYPTLPSSPENTHRHHPPLLRQKTTL